VQIETEMTPAFIGLGSNVGDREENIKKAISLLKNNINIKVKKVSSLYETEPVGYVDQGEFLNAAIEIETDLTPHELLKITKGIEEKLKRDRKIKWGPRTIDLDILLFGDLRIDEPHLNVPHPEIKNRAFVLIPLAEIAGQIIHPDGKTIDDLLRELIDVKSVRKYR